MIKKKVKIEIYNLNTKKLFIFLIISKGEGKNINRTQVPPSNSTRNITIRITVLYSCIPFGENPV